MNYNIHIKSTNTSCSKFKTSVMSNRFIESQDNELLTIKFFILYQTRRFGDIEFYSKRQFFRLL